MVEPEASKMDVWFDSGDEVSDEKSAFPGLNKAHGFFHLIKRNQTDRDSYHREQEDWKQVRLLVLL